MSSKLRGLLPVMAHLVIAEVTAPDSKSLSKAARGTANLRSLSRTNGIRPSRMLCLSVFSETDNARAASFTVKTNFSFSTIGYPLFRLRYLCFRLCDFGKFTFRNSVIATGNLYCFDGAACDVAPDGLYSET